MRMTAHELDEIKDHEGLEAAVRAAVESGCELTSGGRRIHFRGGGSRLVNPPPDLGGAGGR